MRRLTEINSANWRLKVNTLIPIQDHCLKNLRDRFADDKLVIFKSCAFLSPERFQEIARSGIPKGALDDLCALAGTDSTVVTAELVTFAKTYKELQKQIQADYPQSKSDVDFSEFDVDFQVISKSLLLTSHYKLSNSKNYFSTVN